MDALWSVEDKLHISTHQAITTLACTATLVILCTLTIAMVVKRRRKMASRRVASHDQEEPESSLITTNGPPPPRPPGCWSGACRWEGNKLRFSGGSKLPVWQRPILMGEKCELPRFSGLILYDDKGSPLPHNHNHNHHDICYDSYDDMHAEEEVGRTTLLKDLL